MFDNPHRTEMNDDLNDDRASRNRSSMVVFLNTCETEQKLSRSQDQPGTPMSLSPED
jgi:hypothetical protein